MPRRHVPSADEINRMQLEWAERDLEQAHRRASDLRKAGFKNEAAEHDLLAANARNRITRLSPLVLEHV